jgi:hypothetical protein
MSTLVISAHTIKITVDHDMLRIEATGRPAELLPRLPKIYDHIVLDCVRGWMHWPADSWLTDSGITWDRLNRSRGRVSGNDLHPDTGIWLKQLTYDGTQITRNLLIAKIEGQALNADLLGDVKAADAIRRHLGTLKRCAPKSLNAYEGHAARAYWDAWARHVKSPYEPDAMLVVQPRWRTYPERRSMTGTEAKTSQRARNASDPVNALLNLAYTAGEAVCVRACHAAGLSPVIGLAHNKKYVRSRDGAEARNSMALDLLETIRPGCDLVVLALCIYGHHTPGYLWRWPDFMEVGVRTSREIPVGTCRCENNDLKDAIFREVSKLTDIAVRYAQDVKLALEKGIADQPAVEESPDAYTEEFPDAEA